MTESIAIPVQQDRRVAQDPRYTGVERRVNKNDRRQADGLDQFSTEKRRYTRNRHGQDPKQIKIWLNEKNIKRTYLLEVCKVSPVGISKVITGVARSEKVEKAIASAIDKPLWEVFPSWYVEGNKRNNYG